MHRVGSMTEERHRTLPVQAARAATIVRQNRLGTRVSALWSWISSRPKNCFPGRKNTRIHTALGRGLTGLARPPGSVLLPFPPGCTPTVHGVLHPDGPSGNDPDAGSWAAWMQSDSPPNPGARSKVLRIPPDGHFQGTRGRGRIGQAR